MNFGTVVAGIESFLLGSRGVTATRALRSTVENLRSLGEDDRLVASERSRHLVEHGFDCPPEEKPSLGLLADLPAFALLTVGYQPITSWTV